MALSEKINFSVSVLIISFFAACMMLSGGSSLMAAETTFLAGSLAILLK